MVVAVVVVVVILVVMMNDSWNSSVLGNFTHIVLSLIRRGVSGRRV